MNPSLLALLVLSVAVGSCKKQKEAATVDETVSEAETAEQVEQEPPAEQEPPVEPVPQEDAATVAARPEEPPPPPDAVVVIDLIKSSDQPLEELTPPLPLNEHWKKYVSKSKKPPKVDCEAAKDGAYDCIVWATKKFFYGATFELEGEWKIKTGSAYMQPDD